MKKGLLFMLTLVCVSFANATVYYWNGSTFSTASNWTTLRTGGGTPASNFTSSGDVFIIQGTGTTTNGAGSGSSNQSLTASSSWTFASGVTLEVEGGATLTATAQIASLGTFVLSGTALYNHNWIGSSTNGSTTDFPATTRTFSSTSTVVIQNWGGSASSSPAALPSSVNWGNLTINITGAFGATWQMGGAITTINGNFSLQSLGSTARAFRFNANSPASFSLYVGGNFSISGGGASAISSGSSTGTHTIAGNLSVSGGTSFDIGGGGGIQSCKVNGNCTVSTGGTLQIGTSSGSDTLTISGLTSVTGGTFNGGTGSSTTTLNANGGLTVSSGTFAPCGSSTSIANINITGDMTVSGTGQTTVGTAQTTYTISQDLNVSSSTGNGFSLGSSSSTLVTVNVGRDINITGSGTMNNTSSGDNIVTVTRHFNNNSTSSLAYRMQNSSSSSHSYILNLGGNFNMTGTGTFTGGSSSSNATINFTGGTQSVTYTQSAGSVTFTNTNFTVANSPNGKTVTLNNGLTLPASRTMTVAVSATLATGVTYTNSGTTTINGIFQINSGGSISTAPIYGSSSTLLYNTGGSYSNGNEWTQNTGTIGTTAGYPNKVQLSTSGTNLTLSSARGLNGLLTVDANTTLQTAATLTTNGNATINGSFQLNTSGFAQTGTWTYGSASTLIYNSSTSYGTSGNHVYWPASNGPVNVTILQGGLDLGSGSQANRTVTGKFTTASGVTLSNNSVLTLNDTCQINSGGFFNNSPTYGSASTLIYNTTSSPYSTGNEWPATNGPVNISIQNTNRVGMNASRTVTGNLTVGSSASLSSNTGSATITMSGTTKTFTNNGTTYGEFSNNLLNLTFSGSITLAGSTGYIDAKNTSVTGTLICNAIGIQSNSNVGSSGTFSLGAGATIKTTKTNGLYDGSSNNTTLRYNSGTLTSGNITLNSTSTVDYNNTSGGQTVSALTYGNLTMSNTSGTQTSGGAIVCNGTLTVTSGGILDMATNQLSGTLTPSGTGTIKTQNTGSTPVTSGKTWTQTVEYNSASGQTLMNGTYAGLTASTGGAKTMSGDVTVSGALTLSSAKVAIAGNTLTIGGTVSGMSASNSLTGSNTSKLSITSTSSVGTVYFDQSTSSDVTVTNGTNALQNFVQSGSGGSVTIGNKLNLFNRLSVSAGTLNTSDALVLRSTTGNTAYVDQVGGTISGQVIVERYFHKQFRGWRMVTAPVTYNGITISNFNNTVYKNWQDSFGYAANYGTRFGANVAPTGTNGLDDQTNGANLLTYNSNGTGSWNRVTNTKTETMSGSNGSADNKGFFLFIRGDRSVVPSGTQTPNSFATTTLAAKGKLQTGPQVFNYGGSANVSWIVGNPYACPVDMSTVTFNNCGNSVYVWDPNLTGINTSSPGAYNVFNMSNWNLAPTGGGSMNKYFQSGQAFLIKPTSTTASVSFAESNKAGGNNSTATTKGSNPAADIFNCILYAVQPNGDRTNVDGYRAMFGSYSAGVDDEDAKKVASSIESITLFRDATNLVIEARPDIITTDSLFVRMSNMVTGSNYEFNFNPINFSQNVTSCMLVDKFLSIETPISLSSNTIIPFTVSSVAGSNAADRFMVVFGTAPLAVKDLQIRGYRKDNKVMVEWTTAKEEDMKGYTVEKSATGNSFTTMATATAKNGINNIYTTVDNTPEAVNYYRIKATGNDGTVTYSKIVRVDVSNAVASPLVKVYPNPVIGNSISLQLNGIAEGRATISIYNALGQLVAAQSITSSGINGSVTVEVDKALAAATYQLQLVDAKGNTTTTQMIKK